MNRYKCSVFLSVAVAMSTSFVLMIVSHLLSTISCECLTASSEGIYHLSSKTPYRLVANTNDSAITFSGCTATNIVGIIRHGTRTPSFKYINGMKNRLPQLLEEFHASNEGSLCPQVWSRLSSWKPDPEIAGEGEKLLTKEGNAEMVALGKRMHSRLSNLFSTPYSNDTYYFKYTASQRTQLSAESFAAGLFGHEEAKKIWYPEAVLNDPILRFYKTCDKWKVDVKKNKEAVKERIEMIESKEVQKFLKNLSRRLGYNTTLTFDEVYLMYMTCSFETAWHSEKTSPWCMVFTLEEFQLMEYVEDLKFYYVDGYGHKLNHEQACPLVEDVFNRLLNGKHKGVFYFTHSGTILKLLSHLGLYQDKEPLQSEDSPDFRRHRLWRTAFIDTFASNIFFILFRCGDVEKLAVMHQERLVTLPWCEEELCPVRTVTTHLQDSVHGCNFSQLCTLRSR